MNLARLIASVCVLVGSPVLIATMRRADHSAAFYFLAIATLGSLILLAAANIVYLDHFRRRRQDVALERALKGIADGELDIKSVPGALPPGLVSALAEVRQAREEDKRVIDALTNERRRAQEEKTRSDAQTQVYVDAHELFMQSFIRALEALAEGRLVDRLEHPFSADYEKLRGCYNVSIDRLAEAFGKIVGRLASVDARTRKIIDAAASLSTRTHQQAANLEETSAALRQIATTVQKTAEGAKHTSDVISEARSDAEKSGEIVRQAIEAMGRIERSSQEIGKIIGVIDEIAFQTNLLAFNAGVEAARAGDAGRGFSVVASEVRALAQRSADAAREIKSLIANSTTQVHEGVQLVVGAGDALERIMERVAEGNEVAAGIASDAKEQAEGLTEASAGIAQMDRFTQQNASLVKEANEICRGLAADIAEVKEAIAAFELPPSISRRFDAAQTQAFEPASARAVTTIRGRGAMADPVLKVEEDDSQDWEEF